MRYFILALVVFVSGCASVDTSLVPTRSVQVPEEVLVERTYVAPTEDEMSEEQTLAYILALYRIIDRLNDDKAILIDYLRGLNTGERK